MKEINLNITSKFKKDVPKEIKNKINKIWDIDFVEVEYMDKDFYKIEYGSWIIDPHINTFMIKINLKEKGKVWNLNKDFNFTELFKNYRKK